MASVLVYLNSTLRAPRRNGALSPPPSVATMTCALRPQDQTLPRLTRQKTASFPRATVNASILHLLPFGAISLPVKNGERDDSRRGHSKRERHPGHVCCRAAHPKTAAHLSGCARASGRRYPTRHAAPGAGRHLKAREERGTGRLCLDPEVWGSSRQMPPRLLAKTIRCRSSGSPPWPVPSRGTSISPD